MKSLAANLEIVTALFFQGRSVSMRLFWLEDYRFVCFGN